jgi:phytoene dehydrogenase-like protein
MKFDAIVIGAGIAGLASAAILAAQNKKVLLLEATDRIGGFQHRFVRNGFSFEPNFHFLQDAGPGRPVRVLLESLGIEQKFHVLDPVARFSFPDLSFDVTNNRDGFIFQLKTAFSKEAAGIDALFSTMHGLYIALTRQQPSPLLAQYGADTVDVFLTRFISDQKLKAVVGAWSAYFGYGAATISALAIAVFTEACWDGGVLHPVGGITSIASKLLGRIEQGGSIMRRKSRVQQLRLANGRASGVKLDDGSVFESDAVISTVDTRSTVAMIADQATAAQLAGPLKPLERFRSPFCVYIGVKSAGLGLRDAPAVRMDFASYDIEAQDKAQLAADIDSAPMPIGIPTRYNPELAPDGHDIVILYTFVPNAMIDSLLNDEVLSHNFARCMAARADRVIPGLTDNIVELESSATATPMLYNDNSKGALGWAPTPEMLPQMPDHKSPVPGLYLAGQWTRTGAGMNNVFASAQIAASMALQQLAT